MEREGVNIIYRHRFLRTGHKDGNLHSTMCCDYVNDYEFVAILDADFQPNPDFLIETVPHFKTTYRSQVAIAHVKNTRFCQWHRLKLVVTGGEAEQKRVMCCR